jgi:hypothetical protein
LLYGDDHHGDRRAVLFIRHCCQNLINGEDSKQPSITKGQGADAMSKEVNEKQRAYSRSFTESVFARFDALDEHFDVLDEHARRLDRRLKLIGTKLEGLSLSEEYAFSASLALALAIGHEVTEVNLLAKRIERRLTIFCLHSGISERQCDE